MGHLDLHRHLEGSHSPSALLEVARAFAIHDPLFYDAAAGRFRTPEELERDAESRFLPTSGHGFSSRRGTVAARRAVASRC